MSYFIIVEAFQKRISILRSCMLMEMSCISRLFKDPPRNLSYLKIIEIFFPQMHSEFHEGME